MPICISNTKKGWVKEIRESLDMSMADLGMRLGTIKQRIERIEKDELSKKVTLATMQKTAEAMSCKFVYFIVPNTSLDGIIKEQIQGMADEVLKVINKTMQLEDQKVAEAGRKQGAEILKNKLLSENKKIWRKK